MFFHNWVGYFKLGDDNQEPCPLTQSQAQILSFDQRKNLMKKTGKIWVKKSDERISGSDSFVRSISEELCSSGKQSICHGFNLINSLTVSAICRHTTSLAMYVRKMLLTLRHENGAVVCTFYGDHTSKVSYRYSGSIVSFNLKRLDGSWFGCREVEKLASLSGIQQDAFAILVHV